MNVFRGRGAKVSLRGRILYMNELMFSGSWLSGYSFSLFVIGLCSMMKAELFDDVDTCYQFPLRVPKTFCGGGSVLCRVLENKIGTAIFLPYRFFYFIFCSRYFPRRLYFRYHPFCSERRASRQRDRLN